MGEVAVLVPVKAFGAAKLRLAPAMGAGEREALARGMAEAVVRAAAPLPVYVACDDRAVASWVETVGATVVWVPDTDLNGAVQEGFSYLAKSGYEMVIVVHADLPHAQRLDRVLEGTSAPGITVVPDRGDDGTNVITVPTSAAEFTFAYGPASFTRHLSEAARVGHPARVLRIPDLQWDVDSPEDLPLPVVS